jgi:hypothetical protein
VLVSVCRAVYKLTEDGQPASVNFHDPTALAMAALCAICPESGPMLDIFLTAGGVTAVLWVLGYSSCQITLQFTVDIIVVLLANGGLPSGPDRRQELADQLSQSGGCGK